MRWRTALTLATVMTALGVGSVVATTYPWESAGASGGCMVVKHDAQGSHTNCPNADLQGAHLEFVDLTYANLSGANLTGAYLTGAQLDNARLGGADLTRAVLTGATGLTDAALTGVVWSATTCPDGTLSGADGDACAGDHLKAVPVTAAANPGPGGQATAAAATASVPTPIAGAAASLAFTG